MSGGNDSFTKILLHMDGANAGTTFTDSNFGGAAHAWTASSATTNTGTIKFGTASLNCGAGVGFITTPDSADFTLGSGDFTIDCWFYRNGAIGAFEFLAGQSDSSATVASQTASLQLSPTNVVQFRVSNASASTNVNGTTAFTTNGWNHVAGVRTGNILRLFVNGVQEGGDVAFSGAVNDSTSVYGVGCAGSFPSNFWNGFIDEFRLSVGIARWTANFTLPTAAYDIGFNADVGTFAATGVASLFRVSQLSATASFSVTGVASLFAISELASVGSFSETGNAALFSLNFAASAAAYSIAGQAAPMITAMSAASGSYIVTVSAGSFVNTTRRPLYIRGSSYWRGRA
jgi:hypothetical protein